MRAPLKRVLAFSPLTGIVGHRQVGKTTLIEPNVRRYVTLDEAAHLRRARELPREFLKEISLAGGCCGIDEAQTAPELFPALKEWVRVHKKPGQFLLSGSVRFTSRRAIRESLTGRIVNLELLPLTTGEIRGLDPSEIILRLTTALSLESFLESSLFDIRARRILASEIRLYRERGGLPGVCFIRNDILRRNKISEQLMTLLDRDARMVYPTTLPYSQILAFAQSLSRNEGRLIRYSQIRREIGLSEATQKKLLFAFEGIFLLRLIAGRGNAKGWIPYFEDQAEALFLDPAKESGTQNAGFIFRHARAQFQYQLGRRFSFFHYSTRGGARVPVAVETDEGILGIISIAEGKPTRSQKASADSFLKTYARSKILFTGELAPAEILNERCLSLPLHALG